jgi:hypothetical protein
MEYVFKSLATPDTIVTVFAGGTKKTAEFRNGFFKTHDSAVANALINNDIHKKYYVIISEVKADESTNSEGTLGTNETEAENLNSEGTLGTNETEGMDAPVDDAIRFKTVNEAKDYLVGKGAPASKMLTVTACTEWAKANGINIVIKR